MFVWMLKLNWLGRCSSHSAILPSNLGRGNMAINYTLLHYHVRSSRVFNLISVNQKHQEGKEVAAVLQDPMQLLTMKFSATKLDYGAGSLTLSAMFQSQVYHVHHVSSRILQMKHSFPVNLAILYCHDKQVAPGQARGGSFRIETLIAYRAEQRLCL